MGTAGQERRRAAGFLVLREFICCCGNQASYCCCFEDDHAGVHCNAELAAKDASLRDGFTRGSPSPTLSCWGWVNQRMMAAKHLSYSVQTRGREEGREGMCATVREAERSSEKMHAFGLLKTETKDEQPPHRLRQQSASSRGRFNMSPHSAHMFIDCTHPAVMAIGQS